MTSDLMIGLWATGLVMALSISLGLLLCWLGDMNSSYV